MTSIFLDVQLPNAGTWLYLSFAVAVGLFLQFNRLLSVRNVDLVALYVFGPGFLLIQEANRPGRATDRADIERFFGYLWLLAGAGFWAVRCLYDLTSIRRPVFRPNLSLVGLAWLGGALFLGLCASAARRPFDNGTAVGKQPAALAGVADGATAVVAQTHADGDTTTAREWVERGLAAAAHLAVGLGLLFVGIVHYREPVTGVAMGTLYLLLPYTAYHFGQAHHVLPAALLVWAVFAYRNPARAGFLAGLAAGATFFPILLFPVWVQFYRGRGAGRFIAGFVTAGVIGLVATVTALWLAGLFPSGVSRAMHLSDWQPWKHPTSTESLWTTVHWAYRLPVFLAFAAFVLMTFFWPPAKHVGHLLALNSAVLIGVQFWYADRGGQYVLWFAPLLLMMVFRPAGQELEPPPPGPEPGWGLRAAAAVWRAVRKPKAAPLPGPTGLAA